MSGEQGPGTALPWANGIGGREGIVATGPVSVVGDGNVVCLPPDPQMAASYDRWPANAAFIVRAANSHFELLEALEELVERAEGFSVSGVYFDEPCMTAEVAALEKARAAISRAQGGVS